MRRLVVAESPGASPLGGKARPHGGGVPAAADSVRARPPMGGEGDGGLGLPLTFLGIAEGRVFDRPAQVRTLLGSCVAVTLHCRALGCGSIFHALLPLASEFSRDAARADLFRYVDTAVQLSLERLHRLGARRATLEAKVFGGACSLVDERVGVGLRNVRAAFEALSAAGVRVAAADVGGDRGRKLLYYPHTGEVFVKLLRPTVGACRRTAEG